MQAQRLLIRFAILVAALASSLAPALAADEKPVSFKKDVAPILVKNCFACHGPTDPKGEYQLHNFAALMKAGESSLASVTPGKLDDSELYRLVSAKDETERMPKDADPLPAKQIDIIRRWIEQGAKFDGKDQAALLTTMLPKKIHAQPPEKYRTPVAITSLAFSPDGKELAVGGYHEITVWSTDQGELLRRIKNVEERVYGLVYLSDGSLLAAAGGTPGQSGEVTLYDPQKGSVARTLATSADVAFGVAFSPDGKQLASCGADRSIRIFDLASGKQQRLIEEHADWVLGIAWNHAGTQLASASRDKSTKVFDVKTGEAVTSFTGHGETVYSVAFGPDDKQVYSGGGDKKIQFWSVADGKSAGVMTGFGEVYKVLVVDKRIFGAGSDKTIREFAVGEPKKEVRAFKGHADYVYAIDFHPGTNRLASGSYDGEVRVWNAENGKPTVTFRAAPGYNPSQTTAQAK